VPQPVPQQVSQKVPQQISEISPEPTTQELESGQPILNDSSADFSSDFSPEPVPDLMHSIQEQTIFQENKNETIAVNEVSNNFPVYETVIDQHLENNWRQLAQNWDSLAIVYNELGGFLGKGWDLTQGLLASQGWQDIAKYQQQVQLLPWLKKLIASLGRCCQESQECQGEEKSLSEEIVQPIKRVIDEEVQIKTPERVMHTSGIKQSDDISRLLPSELALLGNSKLKILWHAKRAERTLLTYEIDGVLSQHEPIEKEQLEPIHYDKDETDLGYGPILVCLDTSASMQGEIESMAKAITLEALRLAFEENRACHLFMFSGPEQVLQHSLDLTSQGLQELLAFISQSFHGGTDILGPLLLALEKVQEQSWEKADILLISDGRFPISGQQKQKIQWARENNDCRIHAVQLGNWQGEGVNAFCDYTHRVDFTRLSDFRQ